MLRKFLVSGFACLVFVGAAYADRWVKLDVTMSATLLQNGDTEMKVTMPQAQYKALGRGMHQPHAVCHVENVNDAPTTTITYLCTAE